MKEIRRLNCDICKKKVDAKNKLGDARFYCMECGRNLGISKLISSISPQETGSVSPIRKAQGSVGNPLSHQTELSPENHTPQTKPDRVKSDNSRHENLKASTASVRRDKTAEVHTRHNKTSTDAPSVATEDEALDSLKDGEMIKYAETSIIERIGKEAIKRFNEDITQEIDPLYDISETVDRDVMKELRDLFEATAIVSAKESMKEMLEAVEKMDEEWEQKIIEHCDFVLEEEGSRGYNQGFADMEKVILKGFEDRKIKLAEMKEELK